MYQSHMPVRADARRDRVRHRRTARGRLSWDPVAGSPRLGGGPRKEMIGDPGRVESECLRTLGIAQYLPVVGLAKTRGGANSTRDAEANAEWSQTGSSDVA